MSATWRESMRRDKTIRYFLEPLYYPPYYRRPMRDLLQNTRRCVYIIRHGPTVVYIGQTRAGLQRRLQKHIAARSPLGRLLAANMPACLDWKITVVFVRGDLLAAERDLIKSYGPALNIRHKSKDARRPEEAAG